MRGKTETKQKILNAAVREFANNPYHIANTNAIAKAAGVSKGAVFLHYKNKKELFLSCLKHLLQKSGEAAGAQGFDRIPDIFDKLTAISRWKAERFKRHPDEYLFIYRALYNCPDEIKKEINEYAAEFSAGYEKQLLYADSAAGCGGYSAREVFKFIQIIGAGIESSFRRETGGVNGNEIGGYFELYGKILNILKKGLLSK